MASANNECAAHECLSGQVVQSIGTRHREVAPKNGVRTEHVREIPGRWGRGDRAGLAARARRGCRLAPESEIPCKSGREECCRLRRCNYRTENTTVVEAPRK